jgi:hypothetical protein
MLLIKNGEFKMKKRRVVFITMLLLVAGAKGISTGAQRDVSNLRNFWEGLAEQDTASQYSGRSAMDNVEMSGAMQRRMRDTNNNWQRRVKHRIVEEPVFKEEQSRRVHWADEAEIFVDRPEYINETEGFEGRTREEEGRRFPRELSRPEIEELNSHASEELAEAQMRATNDEKFLKQFSDEGDFDDLEAALVARKAPAYAPPLPPVQLKEVTPVDLILAIDRSGKDWYGMSSLFFAHPFAKHTDEQHRQNIAKTYLRVKGRHQELQRMLHQFTRQQGQQLSQRMTELLGDLSEQVVQAESLAKRNGLTTLDDSLIYKGRRYNG